MQMVDLAVISGSGFYDFPDLADLDKREISTRYGSVIIGIGCLNDKNVAFLARHGHEHQFLPNLINYRANLLALKELGSKGILSTTVCGVLDAAIPLAKPVVFSDLYFPDNRLPSGEICSIYDEEGLPGRGHYIFDRPFSEALRQRLIAAAKDPLTEAIYAHVNGPRFNSKPEIQALKSHASFVSQTAGPEIVLAGELEIPIALIGYGVDYANGVSDQPTPVEALQLNLLNSKSVFVSIITKVIQNYIAPRFEGFIYRFG
jgi:5'-methylthioadenosine phosphorylase